MTEPMHAIDQKSRLLMRAIRPLGGGSQVFFGRITLISDKGECSLPSSTLSYPITQTLFGIASPPNSGS